LKWQVFWLAFFLWPSRRGEPKQWQGLQKVLQRLTAAGTAPVSHRIPYYSNQQKLAMEPFQGVKVEIIFSEVDLYS